MSAAGPIVAFLGAHAAAIGGIYAIGALAPKPKPLPERDDLDELDEVDADEIIGEMFWSIALAVSGMWIFSKRKQNN